MLKNIILFLGFFVNFFKKSLNYSTLISTFTEPESCVFSNKEVQTENFNYLSQKVDNLVKAKNLNAFSKEKCENKKITSMSKQQQTEYDLINQTNLNIFFYSQPLLISAT